MPLQRTDQHWLIKYKLYHLPFWCLYHYIWGVIAVGNPFKAASTMFLLPYAIKFAFYVLLQAAAVYFNLYYLIPRYLEKSRFTLYITYLLVTILCTASLIVTGYYLSAFVTGKSFEAIYGPGTLSVFFLQYRFAFNPGQHDPGNEYKVDEKLDPDKAKTATTGKRKPGNRIELFKEPVQSAFLIQYHQLHLFSDP
jgi:hypothetical protein